MTDVVVTVPQSFGLDTWIDEGDAAGEEWSGQEWDFYLAGLRPVIKEGERVYVVYNGALRGYAPLVRIDSQGGSRFSLVRHGGAVAVTIPEFIQGFRGWRYRWWDRSVEVPFPDWKTPNACIGFTRGKAVKLVQEHICRQAYGPGPAGTHCKDCIHFIINHWSKGENKCELRKLSNGAATNHGADWPTCGRFQPGETKAHYGPYWREQHPGSRVS